MPKINRNRPRGVFNQVVPKHSYADGNGHEETHPGLVVNCPEKGCQEWVAARIIALDAKNSEIPPWGYTEEPQESWTNVPERPDPLGPCPKFGKHLWVWGDDGNGHSADICACGAYEE